MLQAFRTRFGDRKTGQQKAVRTQTHLDHSERQTPELHLCANRTERRAEIARRRKAGRTRILLECGLCQQTFMMRIRAIYVAKFQNRALHCPACGSQTKHRVLRALGKQG